MPGRPRIHRAWSIVVGAAVVAGLSMTGPVAAGGAPPNDAYAAAVVITALPFRDVTGTAGASTEVGEPIATICGQPTHNTLWYRFTPTVTQFVRAHTTGVVDDVQQRRRHDLLVPVGRRSGCLGQARGRRPFRAVTCTGPIATRSWPNG